MEKAEERKHPRVNVFNPVSYAFLDSDQKSVVENISVALNASQNGIQIETFTEIFSKYILLRFKNLELSTFEIEGKVIYCERQESGIFKTGVKLMGTDAENANFVNQLVQFYNFSKETYRPGVVLKEQNLPSSNIDTIQL
jgi:hypothetical protein